MAYHEVLPNETRRGSQHVVGMAVLIYCAAAVLGLLHFVQKYVPVHAAAGLAAPRELNGSATRDNASNRETSPPTTCPAGHFCAYPFGNQSRIIDCTANDGPFMDPCYFLVTDVVSYAFRTPVLSIIFPLLPAALALLCQAWGNGAGEIMQPSSQVSVKVLKRLATYAAFMIVFHWFYFVKARLEREFLGDYDASDTVAVFMLGTTVAWREYAHVCKSRGSDYTTWLILVTCIAQLISSMYIIYNTCQYFHRPWESIGGMIEGWLVCYFLFYVTTADSGVFIGFAGTPDAPFNSPGLFNMPRREPFIPKNDNRRQKPGAALEDALTQNP